MVNLAESFETMPALRETRKAPRTDGRGSLIVLQNKL